MGYQALLFCPDEKTARTVTQVLSELDFAVTPCTEPFAAVKKLMAEHFDAVVVDCDNEQNATLLFKSARNTPANQSSLAVAVVEGQAGVAKAFRIGANLVLTKPINVEQAKGTLRVARGLLRKNEAAKPATAAGNAKQGGAVSSPSQEAAISHFDVTPAATSSTAIAAATASGSGPKPSHLAQGSVEHFETSRHEIASPLFAKAAAQPFASEASPDSAPAKVQETPSRAGFGNSAASAPAPAREPKAGASTPVKESAVLPEAEAAGNVAESKDNKTPVDAQLAPAPMFTFGGTVKAEESAGGGIKKIILIAVAAVVIAAASYAAWTHWGRRNDSTAVPAQVVEPPVKAPAAIPQAAPSQAPVAKPSNSDFQTTATVENVQPHPGKITATTDSAKPSPSAAVVNKAPATTEDAEPIVIKNNLSKPATKSHVISDAPAPPSMTIAPAGNGGLPNLMDSASSAPTPVLQTLSVSQGVSQGLLLKKVQPKYPPNALHLRVEGAVQLMATISKMGDISEVKILAGDPQLAHAALDAVKQWKYKPYLLNGEPVEIQTQVTVNFKLPN
jgi:periplasmic protein TonB